MAFLANRKVDLARLEEEIGIEITSEDRVIDICKKIKNSPDYEEEFAKGQLDVIVPEREAEAEIARAEPRRRINQEGTRDRESLRT
ncbi:hypothetical protein AVEN_247702-1 [Araneus ventricosus]|uniref:Uncharacterized protein n=1 Tax=Araneus ventricosus TaxID=182803 RepID=A0A4Y2GNJ9_ARAVE|nr:hypothetical protein AVEN_247702-1 [Araneus ventricosus]